MKYFLLFFMMSFLCVTYTQAQSDPSPGELNGKVKFVASTIPGTITVESIGFAKKMAGSSFNAASGAIYTLIFRGIAGSQYELPMISNENEKKNDPVIKSLLDEGYTSFITENTLIGEDNKKRKKDGAKGKMATYRITINCDALRRHLEQNGVIRKFGI